MPEFLTLLSPDEARTIFLKHHSRMLASETLDTMHALGRVCAENIYAPHALPTFPRTTVDGYAVRAEDTYGASEALPMYIELVGEIEMGVEPQIALSAGQCVLIHTGGMLPAGATAVVMLEHTQLARPGEIEILKAVAIGENTIQPGEDAHADDLILPAGQRIRPAEIGGLMAFGIMRVAVTRFPRVGIISTGDELIAPGSRLAPGQVRDINSYSLSALVTQVGGLPIRFGIIADQEQALKTAVSKALNSCDVVLITAGSSASQRDLTARVIQAFGAPGVLVHGVNLRPGKPTILATCAGKPVIGLPGNPVSALVAARLFLRPLIETLLGLPNQHFGANWEAGIEAILEINLPSQSGREDWFPVRLRKETGQEGLIAQPIFGKSNLIFNLVQCDGLIRIPPAVTGLGAGECVKVFPLT